MLLRHVGRGPITAGDVPEIERPSAECGPADWLSPGFEMALRAAVSAGIGLKNIGRAAEDAAYASPSTRPTAASLAPRRD